jgi:predicted ATP-dependent protease
MGSMILTGYMQGQYAQDKPLSLSFSIGFEQTYSEIDDDNASSTELYSLISALSGILPNQGIAVTRSVNQAGDVQAIGGGTYKIERFYDVCNASGLTGSQGVMVLKDNLKSLMMEDEVVQPAKSGNFHIYTVATIDEGLDVLTGVAAGERHEDGSFPACTVYHAVESQLAEFRKKARDHAGFDDDASVDEDEKSDDNDAFEEPEGSTEG